MIAVLPLGFLFSFAAPWGWSSISGVALSLWLKDLRLLLISLISCVIFGIYWPKVFVALMCSAKVKTLNAWLNQRKLT